ncbi:MAG: hypothetical protein JRG91_02695, partial [Deltaproteobacteria bacterium]|nr:hypothetical protein [Deltaproteobacteria bacterium]
HPCELRRVRRAPAARHDLGGLHHRGRLERRGDEHHGPRRDGDALRPAGAGRIDSYEYDPDTLRGTLVFTSEAGGVTEISVPARLYPDGVSAALEGVDGCVESCTPSVLHVLTAETGTATLTFRPAG